jgi:hypothetical protein
MKKRKRISNSIVISYGSLAITLVGVLWNIFFGYGKLVANIEALQDNLNEFKISVDKRFDKIETKLDKLEEDFHKMDVRVTTIEQSKP